MLLFAQSFMFLVLLLDLSKVIVKALNYTLSKQFAVWEWERENIGKFRGETSQAELSFSVVQGRARLSFNIPISSQAKTSSINSCSSSTR